MNGSIYKRGTTWSYMLDIGVDPLTGKRKQKGKGGFRTKKDAQEAAANVRVQLGQGTYVEKKDMTFEEFSLLWVENYKKHGKVKKDGTFRVRDHERRSLMPFFKLLIMSTITEEMYQNALIGLRAGGYINEEGGAADPLSYNTVKGIHTTGGMIFEFALKKKVINADPTDSAHVPQDEVTVESLENNTEIPKFMEKEDLAIFLNTASIHGLDLDYEMFNTLAYTGMRAGEMCALKETDVSIELDQININKTLYNPNNNYRKFKLTTPKTKTSIRVIDVERPLIEMLQNLITTNKIEKSKKPNVYWDNRFVFAKKGEFAGCPQVIKMVELRMSRLLRLAGLSQDLTPHSLRHTHTSLLAEAGVSLEQIMERLGHSDDKITKKIYLHITKSRKKEASQKFTELMRGLKNESEVNKPLTTE